jgi:hypothetical protein
MSPDNLRTVEGVAEYDIHVINVVGRSGDMHSMVAEAEASTTGATYSFMLAD